MDWKKLMIGLEDHGENLPSQLEFLRYWGKTVPTLKFSHCEQKPAFRFQRFFKGTRGVQAKNESNFSSCTPISSWKFIDKGIHSSRKNLKSSLKRN